MDFQDLINLANSNKAAAKSEAAVKRYSSTLPPPKKSPKPSVQPENVKKFLAKKKAEEEKKALAAQRKKDQLLSLRAQSTKNSKTAKLMASRTKDNDFSKIKLTEDEREAQRRTNAELMKKNLSDKVERMKARIALEEQQKLEPKKRKRKSKHEEDNEDGVDEHIEEIDEYLNSKNNNSKNPADKPKKVQTGRPPSFQELLKLAEKKKYEPLKIPVVKKEEERLLTKKEKELMMEEQQRQKRKQKLLEMGIEPTTRPRPEILNVIKPATKKSKGSNSGSSNTPVVVHVEKDNTQDSSPNFKIPKRPPSDMKKSQNSLPTSSRNNISPKNSATSSVHKTSKVKPSEAVKFQKERAKIAKQGESLKSTPSASEDISLEKINPNILAAIQEKISKTLEEKFAAKYGLKLGNNAKGEPSAHRTVSSSAKTSEGIKHKTSTIKMTEKIKTTTVNKEMPNKERKKAVFHKNPYLAPPRRLLEPQRPIKPPPKRRIESDEEDDDDMSDFIDDSRSQNDEDYSKYIKELFGYDRNKYVDEDDDEVMESTYAQQMVEETRSAKLGYLEDLEEEKREIEMRKKKKLKK